ncbi:MAG: response regulator transcription factor [Planctomycetes bacterium]|nr:response regulator transcription factor [Planctomycetota bacterium]
MTRVLVIEDERKVLRSLQRGLQAEAYDVVTAANGDDGFQQASSQSFDCLILDLMLPGRDGLQVLADLRKAGKIVPVIILTARDTIEDRVIGLDAGADDYLVKPFAFAELLARLRVLLRRDRWAASDRETVLVAADLEVDLVDRVVRRDGEEIPLSHREFDLLVYLVKHKNTIVTRDMLGKDVWKEPNYALTNVIDTYMSLLRKKLEKPDVGPLIQTLRGLGYRLRAEPWA